MKHCPKCKKEYQDETLNFCLDDGVWLNEARSMDEPATAILSEPGAVATGFRGGEEQTRPQILTTDQTCLLYTSDAADE